MRDRALTSSLNVQNLIISNAANIPSCHSFSWWIGGRDCAMKFSLISSCKNSDADRSFPYRVDVAKMTRR
jgi:hypothetical protein